MLRFFKRISHTLGRIIDSIFNIFELPFFLPFYLPQGSFLRYLVLPLFFINVSVCLDIYIYLIHRILLASHFTDADVSLFAPLSSLPADHFDTTFFVFFFPLVLLYIYITQTDQWNVKALKNFFAEYESTPKKQGEQKQDDKRIKKERTDFIVRSFWHYFVRIFLGMFLLSSFTLLPPGLGIQKWSFITLLFWILSAILAFSLALLMRERKEGHERRMNRQTEKTKKEAEV